MATGINVQEMNNLKVGLLDYIESINALYKRFANCSYMIGQNISGAGRTTIMSLLESTGEQFPIVTSNINTYIGDMNKVQSSYVEQDHDLSEQIISDISLVENMKGE